MRMFVPSVSSPVLRLYSWKPEALSLGRFQNAAQALDLDRCLGDGVPIVRRMTGGGVMYHGHELTYSLVCTPEYISSVSIQESFRVLTRFLLLFYRRLGLEARFACDVAQVEGRLGVKTEFCYAGRERYDILIDGRKIGGNAQRRTRELIFQHGSIPLSSDVDRGLSYMRNAAPGCRARTTSLVECGIDAARTCLEMELIAAFEESSGADLRESVLATDEQSLFNCLKNKKYNSDNWNLTGGRNGD